MTVLVTRNVPDRYRGFLASCMLEVAPGVYVSPDMSAGVRERVWAVCCEWAGVLPDDGGVLMACRDSSAPSGLSLSALGWPRADMVEVDGMWLARTDADRSLITE